LEDYLNKDMKKSFSALAISGILFALSVHSTLAFDLNREYGSPFSLTLDVSKLISSFSSNAIVIAGIILLISVILAGYHMLSHSGEPDKFAAGKDIITYAVMGFLLIFGAYWIIQLLQFMLGLTNTGARVIQ
jgi:hypothetical protein